MTLTFKLRPILIIFNEEGIVICANNEHLEKADSRILVTEEGIVICDNDEQPKKKRDPISFLGRLNKGHFSLPFSITVSLKTAVLRQNQILS